MIVTIKMGGLAPEVTISRTGVSIGYGNNFTHEQFNSLIALYQALGCYAEVFLSLLPPAAPIVSTPPEGEQEPK